MIMQYSFTGISNFFSISPSQSSRQGYGLITRVKKQYNIKEYLVSSWLIILLKALKQYLPENYCLLVCDALWSGRYFLTFGCLKMEIYLHAF
jgi:hypothetical protein